MCTRSPNPTSEGQAPPGAAGTLSVPVSPRASGTLVPLASECLSPAPATPRGQPEALSSLRRPPQSRPGSGHGRRRRGHHGARTALPLAGPRGPACPLASRSACAPGPAGGLGPAVWTPVPHPPVGLWVPSPRLGFSMPHSFEHWAGCPPTAQVSGPPYLCLQRGAPPRRAWGLRPICPSGACTPPARAWGPAPR